MALIREQVGPDVAAGEQGINATPTYLVDGQAVNAGGLRAAIDAALRAKGR